MQIIWQENYHRENQGVMIWGPNKIIWKWMKRYPAWLRTDNIMVQFTNGDDMGKGGSGLKSAKWDMSFVLLAFLPMTKKRQHLKANFCLKNDGERWFWVDDSQHIPHSVGAWSLHLGMPLMPISQEWWIANMQTNHKRLSSELAGTVVCHKSVVYSKYHLYQSPSFVTFAADVGRACSPVTLFLVSVPQSHVSILLLEVGSLAFWGQIWGWICPEIWGQIWGFPKFGDELVPKFGD